MLRCAPGTGVYGVTEWKSEGFKTQYSNIPFLGRLASEIFSAACIQSFSATYWSKKSITKI
jgi:hypothetical protein